MSLRVKRKRRGASITSLIDVIFLLLLFFMLASTFSQHSELELVASAESNAGSGADASEVVRLLITPDRLEIDGHATDEAALLTTIKETMPTPKSLIAVQLTEDVTTQRLIDILLIMKTMPDARILVEEPS